MLPAEIDGEGWLLRDPRRIGWDAPIAPALARHLGVSSLPFVRAPGARRDALMVGSAVVRPARSAVGRAAVRERGMEALSGFDDWCHAVDGTGAGHLVPAGSRLDALRLAIRYGLADAILVGAETVRVEGMRSAAAGPWWWQSDTPLRFPQLADDAAQIAEGIRSTRAHWQDAGWLSSRARPALVVVASGRPGSLAWLDAPALSTLRDGSPAEAWILTSVASAERVRSAARRTGMDQRVIALSPPGRPDALDLARVPHELSARLDARLVGHDGGRSTLQRFMEASSVDQLDLTFVGAPPLASVDPGGRFRRFFGAGVRPGDSLPVMALLGMPGEDAWIASLDVRGRSLGPEPEVA